MEHLDRYEREGIDADFVEDMDAEAALDARARAERDLDRRDAREGRVAGRRRLPGALEGKIRASSWSSRLTDDTRTGLATTQGCNGASCVPELHTAVPAHHLSTSRMLRSDVVKLD